MTQSFLLQLPTKIYYGCGELANVSERIKEIGGKRVLIVTDDTVNKTVYMQRLLKSLKRNGINVIVYDKVIPNPAVKHVEEGITLGQEYGCDLIIGFGGGSSLDCAKAIALMMSNEGKISDYWGSPPANKSMPLIAIPTTAGTSSEITWVTVIKDETKKVKMGIASPKLAPIMAIYDPEVTISVPPDLTASIGMDTLTHAIESYINKKKNPVTDLVALEAIRLIGENLRTAVVDGNNINARHGMLLATLYAGIAFANTGLGIVHAITAVLGGVFPVSHGIVNAILLPPCMKFNMESSIEKFSNIAMVMGEKVDGLFADDAAVRAVEAVSRLSMDVGIPNKLRDVGVKKALLEDVVDEAMKNVNIAVNPRQPNKDDLLKICLQVI